MCRDTVTEVRDGSGHPEGGPGRVGTPSGRSGMGWDSLRKVWDGLGHNEGVSERVGTP